jgi:hypothetical protein
VPVFLNEAPGLIDATGDRVPIADSRGDRVTIADSRGDRVAD